MNYLRKNLLRNIFSLLMLSLLVTKFFAFSVAIFLSSDNTYAIEKSSEENKTKEEESFEKLKKKLLLYESSVMACLNSQPANCPLVNQYDYQPSVGNFPAKNVPTPPPDLIS